MKRIISQALSVTAALLFSVAATAQLKDNFNTRTGATQLNQVEGFLVNRCWEFRHMDINANGAFDPAIDGDGAMVSLPLQNGNAAAMISPVLDIPGSMAVNFFYKLNADAQGATRLKLSLLSGHDNSVFMELDNFNLAGKQGNTQYLFSKTFNGLPSGPYKLMVEYSNPNNSSQIGIDKLETNVNQLYANGCNQPPVAVNDQITGKSNRTAEGQVKTNDYDPNGDYLTAYLITNSAHGTVELNENGTFTFTPNASFNGSSTTFTYQQCDNGYGPSCSNIATVTINFATGMLPVKLADFRVSVNNSNDVTINWTTTYEQGSDRFEVERSFDGANFEVVGSVKAAGNSFSKKDYAYIDKLSNSVANKKDVYYRLRLIDVNGSMEETKILVLRMFRTQTLKMVSVTPNPVVNDINVQVQLKENSFVVMKVTNSHGAEVARKSSRGNEGSNVFELDGTSKLKPGVYMLEVIINSSERMSIKLIKN